MSETNLDLYLIIPVFNEEDIIEHVVNEWHQTLNSLAIQFKICIYDGGSTDKTLEKLTILNKKYANCCYFECPKFHGPTLVEAYNTHTDSEWIFQVDSDNEISASFFKEFWDNRHNHDFLIGYRSHRKQPFFRLILTKTCSFLVSMLFGRHIQDLNIPFRLMKTATYKPLFNCINVHCHCPNVLISAMTNNLKLATKQFPVRYIFRTTGQDISYKKLIGIAANCFFSILFFGIQKPYLKK